MNWDPDCRVGFLPCVQDSELGRRCLASESQGPGMESRGGVLPSEKNDFHDIPYSLGIATPWLTKIQMKNASINY